MTKNYISKKAIFGKILNLKFDPLRPYFFFSSFVHSSHLSLRFNMESTVKWVAKYKKKRKKGGFIPGGRNHTIDNGDEKQRGRQYYRFSFPPFRHSTFPFIVFFCVHPCHRRGSKVTIFWDSGNKQRRRRGRGGLITYWGSLRSLLVRQEGIKYTIMATFSKHGLILRNS